MIANCQAKCKSEPHRFVHQLAGGNAAATPRNRSQCCNEEGGTGHGDTPRELLLRSCRNRSERSAGGDGVLPLQFVPIVVGRSGECVHLMEARKRHGDDGRRFGRALHENEHERPAVLHEMRWSSHDQPSTVGHGGRLCRDDTERGIRARPSRQLCRESAANKGRVAEAQGLPRRNGRLGSCPARIGRMRRPLSIGWCMFIVTGKAVSRLFRQGWPSTT
jgi:hypothetical protein